MRAGGIGLLTIVASMLSCGPAAAQMTRTVAVAELLGQPVEIADARLAPGLLKTAWAGRDGTLLYTTTPATCRVQAAGETDPMRLAVLARDGRVIAVLRQSGLRFDLKRKARQRVMLSGADAFAPAPGRLPGEDGLEAVGARLNGQAMAADAAFDLRCPAFTLPPAPRAPTAGEQLVALPGQAVAAFWFAPVWLFGVPAENRSREVGATQGPLALAEIQLGEPLAGGVAGFRARHPAVTRVHGEAEDYAVVTIDLGGPPGRGVSLPREAVYVGVRGGIVEWIGDGAGGLGHSLCTTADGRFGGRQGCSTTGYYSPRV